MDEKSSALAMGSGMKFAYPEGATPLEPVESKGLKLPHITTREELNKWESDNILAAELRFFNRAQRDVLNEGFLLRVHREMFRNVWRWAGRYRTTDKNLGVPHWDVGVKVVGLCEDAKLWIEARDPADEIAARFHHRLVSIHPFANGNGRHARMMADLLLIHILKKPRFTWGSAGLATVGEARSRYLAALRTADSRNYAPLFAFVRS